VVGWVVGGQDPNVYTKEYNMAVTIENLYARYHDLGEYAGESKAFAEDIWEIFGVEGGVVKDAEEFAQKFGMYLPAYQETPEHLAFQEKHTSYTHAVAANELAKKAAENLYSTEMEKASGSLEDELEKARSVAGGLGLRTGTLSSAVETSIESASNKAENLGDMLSLEKEANLNAYNLKISDAALDYEKDIYQNKKDFYESVMAAITRITTEGAFDQAEKSCDIGFTIDDMSGSPTEGECIQQAEYEYNLELHDVDPEETIDEHIGDVLDEALMDVKCVSGWQPVCWGGCATYALTHWKTNIPDCTERCVKEHC
jgi:hypothetical protein